MATWMVVEDEPDIYEVLLAMFEMWGIEGVAFVDGEEAVAWVDDLDKGVYRGDIPELVLLDIRLPGVIDGVAVGERIRKSTTMGDVPIVITSAYIPPSPEAREDILRRTRADLWIHKPLPKFNELQGVLEGVIAKYRERVKGNAGAPLPAPEEVTQRRRRRRG